jgi:hypothetical protein
MKLIKNLITFKYTVRIYMSKRWDPVSDSEKLFRSGSDQPKIVSYRTVQLTECTNVENLPSSKPPTGVDDGTSLASKDEDTGT